MLNNLFPPQVLQVFADFGFLMLLAYFIVSVAMLYQMRGYARERFAERLDEIKFWLRALALYAVIMAVAAYATMGFSSRAIVAIFVFETVLYWGIALYSRFYRIGAEGEEQEEA